MPAAVTDSRSNAPDQIALAARTIGKSDHRRRVFDAVCSGRKKTKTMTEVAKATGLSRVQVSNAAAKLVSNHLIGQPDQPGEIVYEKDRFLSAHKKEILRLAGDPAKLAAFPTKTNPGGAASRTAVQIIKMPVPKNLAPKVKHITVDDIASFSKVRKIAKDQKPVVISEDKFKRGVQKVIGEGGTFKDWGGERNDLFTTNLTVSKKRVRAAFAFKGPGKKGVLTPGKMGTNGDQIQRLLLDNNVDVYVLQYWYQIGQSVYEQLDALAAARSMSRGGVQVTYCVIDGSDSARLIAAYPTQFGKKGTP